MVPGCDQITIFSWDTVSLKDGWMLIILCRSDCVGTARAMEHLGTARTPFHQSKWGASYNIVERVVVSKHLPKVFFARKK
jgi:hypothetical protein